jgi:hypothetical protein
MRMIERIKATFPTNSLELNDKTKKNFYSVLFIFILYGIAILSIIRANFSYLDDLRRCIEGYGLASVFSRHISKFLSHLLHTDSRLTDISPLPQLVACFILAIAGFILVKIICNKTNKFLLLASLPIGLSPYFLECFSYKFDSPYMAISILACIFPFLFMQKKWWIFSLVCFASTLVMTMTYQAASGIFLMLIIYFFFTNLLYKKNRMKENFVFLGSSLVSFCIAVIIFRLFFMQQVDFGYTATNVASADNLIPIFIRNIKKYFWNLQADFNIKWKILTYTILLIFYIKTIFFSKYNKILSFFLTTLFLSLLIVSIFGLYLFLQSPIFLPRSMYSFGVFIAILSIDIAFSMKKIFSIPAIVLIWFFFVFSFSYGNALSDQKRYNNFRTELLLHDLSVSFPDKTDNPYLIRIINNVGFSPVVENIAAKNPFIKKLVPMGLADKGWGLPYFTQYYKFKLKIDDTIVDENMPVVFDSYYHTIKSNDNQIIVFLK